MAEIRIHRDHNLGLAQARQVAAAWAEEVRAKFDMQCTVVEGDTRDTVSFSRTGVSGTFLVAAESFELQATLGFLLGAFSKSIEVEITRNLDALLNARRAGAPPVSGP
jgi:putative polyhydroxyalkanoate system protein